MTVNLPAASSATTSYLSNKRSPATRDAYRADLGAFARFLGAEPAEAERVVLHAGVQHVIGWRDQMIADGLAPVTVARRLSSVRSFFNFAKSIGAVAMNPAELVEAPRVEAARQRAPHLEARQARKLLAAPDMTTKRGLRDRALLGVLACSGLRRAEAAGLRVADVRQEPAGVSVTVDGKGGRVRTVDVDRATADSLIAYLAADGRVLGPTNAPLFRPLRNPRGGGNLDKHLSLRAVNAIVSEPTARVWRPTTARSRRTRSDEPTRPSRSTAEPRWRRCAGAWATLICARPRGTIAGARRR
ncbi:MAG: site-specific integrase [Deltaproteobacteria bacterium]|nr:site-specific integrase [Deltaproteobacteria bacterium]